MIRRPLHVIYEQVALVLVAVLALQVYVEEDRDIDAEAGATSAWNEELDKLEVGMDKQALEELLDGRRGYRPITKPWLFTDDPGACILDDDWELHLTYGPKDRLGSWAIMPRGALPHLRKQIPRSLYPDLRLVHASPRGDLGGAYERFDPVALIRAVNRLHSAGESHALRVLKYYAELADRLHPDRGLRADRIIPILMLLYVPRDGSEHMPAPGLGHGGIWLPKGNRSWPLFPMALVHDVPFTLVRGYVYTGDGGGPHLYLEYCRKECKFREWPLSPSVLPHEAADQLVGAKAWRELFDDYCNSDREGSIKAFVRWQAFRSVAFSLAIGEISHSWLNSDDKWREVTQKIQKTQVQWSDEKQAFVIPAGKP